MENTKFGKDLLNKGIFTFLRKKVTLTIPSNYNHNTFVDEFAKKTRDLESTNYYNNNITSENFAKVTNKLIPGKKYQIKMFPILKNGVTSEECLAFLEQQGAILVGAQGLFLLQQEKPNLFPKDKWTLSFDEKDALWEDADGDHRVPCVCWYSDGDWRFYLSYFGGGRGILATSCFASVN